MAATAGSCRVVIVGGGFAGPFVTRALRRREATWAERRLAAEQLRRAKEAIQRQTKGWGLAPSTVTADRGTGH